MFNNRALGILCFFLVLSASACSPAADSEPAEVGVVLGVAQDFVDGYYHQFPEEAFEIAYPDTPMDQLGDRSQEAMREWAARQDGWLTTLRAIDPAVLEGTVAAVPYAFALDRLEASEGRRVCQTQLWNVSPTSNGWQAMLSSTFAQQPVATDQERATALIRLQAISAYLDTEIENLRAGRAQGYLAPQTNVAAVLRQLDRMLEGPPMSSPFFDPGSRAQDDAFAALVEDAIAESINPAIARYRDFLEDEYMGRDEVGVGHNPDGALCYSASVRFHTSLAIDASDVHETGLREMNRIQAAMSTIAKESFATDDVGALLERFRTDPEYTFRSEEEILSYARAAVDRGAVGVHDWFGFVPDAELVVQPFPAYQKASGGGYYSAGSLDGSRPGTYELGTYLPETISKAGLEATAFHESYPGHHLQMSVALRGKNVHPLLRYMYVASMAEGWGLYTESLADEMGLYSSDLDRMGMLSNQALRAARLVVDPGMHVLGWSRGQAISYMLENTAENRANVESEVDRYLATPGQATAYMTGSLEIQRMRSDAEQTLGGAFDVKGFHDTILADGAVSLPMLQGAVNRWVLAQAER
ncbi:MAG: hypothetical protein ACI80V_003137 [Rhodothermales bacterium]|jgi:uncharacterized protein (DUF885 family)